MSRDKTAGVTGPRLTATRIRAGVWEGVLHTEPGAQTPAIEVMHLERPLAGVQVLAVPERPGTWAVRVPIPAEVLSDGVQTFVIGAAAQDTTLGHFSIITGAGAEDDFRAEIDLLRAELDMLKRAFRRHCLETMG